MKKNRLFELTKILSIVIAGVLICFASFYYVEVPVALGMESSCDYYSSKISDELKKQLEDGAEELSVGIWLKEMDKEYFWNKAQDKVGIYLSELEKREFIIQQEYADYLSSKGNILPKEYFDELLKISNEVDKICLAEREIYAENNNEVINSFIETYKLSEIVYKSQYAPFIVCSMDKVSIEKISIDERVDEICLEHLTISEAKKYHSTTNNNITDSVNTTYKQAMEIDILQNGGFTGIGVNVGLLDSIRINPTSHSELSGSNVTPIGGATTSNKGTHAKNMARIICGVNGIAISCHLYNYGCGDDSNWMTYRTGIESLISEGVSVINASIGEEDRDALGFYTEFEKWIDHIAYEHGVTFVTAAGNSGNYNGYISDPGEAYNAITVANYDHVNNTIHSTSSYIYESGCNKPDILSAGANVLMYNGSNKGGTSAATACTTGIIALLLQSKPTLKTKPHVIKAVLLASADNVGTYINSNGYISRQGAGLISAYRSYRIIQLNQYYSSSTSANGEISITKNVASGGNTTTVSLAAIKRNIVSSGSHITATSVSSIEIPSLRLTVRNINNSAICSSDMTNSSTELLRNLYDSKINIKINITDIVLGPVSWAVAWYS